MAKLSVIGSFGKPENRRETPNEMLRHTKVIARARLAHTLRYDA